MVLASSTKTVNQDLAVALQLFIDLPLKLFLPNSLLMIFCHLNVYHLKLKHLILNHAFFHVSTGHQRVKRIIHPFHLFYLTLMNILRACQVSNQFLYLETLIYTLIMQKTLMYLPLKLYFTSMILYSLLMYLHTTVDTYLICFCLDVLTILTHM